MASTLTRNLLLTLVLAMQWAAPLTPVFAQIAEPADFFAAPVPDEIRGPFTDFLNRLSVKDATSIVAKTRFNKMGFSNSLGFRIEDKDYGACSNNRCLTIIGHLAGQKFTADAMFLAGAKVQTADTAIRFAGALTFPYLFKSTDGDVAAIEMREGWVVVPIKN